MQNIRIMRVLCGVLRPCFLWAALVSLAVSPSLLADVAENNRHEVEHLLEFIASSPCQLERNGKYHSASEALSHIKKKYSYFVDDIETAEDFIHYSATKSLLSGRYYHVRCPGEAAVKTADWLLEELQRYRDRPAGRDVQSQRELLK